MDEFLRSLWTHGPWCVLAFFVLYGVYQGLRGILMWAGNKALKTVEETVTKITTAFENGLKAMAAENDKRFQIASDSWKSGLAQVIDAHRDHHAKSDHVLATVVRRFGRNGNGELAADVLEAVKEGPPRET